jgi:hypothetical protein
MKMIVQASGTHGFGIAHKYVDALLRKMDEGFFTNPVTLMRAGEHNVILDVILRQQAATLGDPAVLRGAARPAGGTSRMVYGVVTTPVGGPGAGLVWDQLTKAPKRCLRYDATPRLECTAGVMPGHPSGKAGWCTFAH